MHSVWIDWGDDVQDDVARYDFATLAELNAFLAGVQAAGEWWGALDFRQYNSQEEVDAHFAEEP